MTTIPKDVAVVLCAKIRHENRDVLYAPRHWQCALCDLLVQEEMTDRWFKNGEGNGGCNLLNQRYQKFLHLISHVA